MSQIPAMSVFASFLWGHFRTDRVRAAEPRSNQQLEQSFPLHDLAWYVAYLYATVHCLFRHGAGPMEDCHGEFVLRCPVCHRVFWHE